MNIWIKQLKVKHWLKNILVFLPYFLAGEGELAQINNLSLAFISFSVLASSIYIYNDLRDIESDRKHPLKMNRPIAAGKIPKIKAYFVMLSLLFLSLVISYSIRIELIFIIIIYVLLNLAYTEFLKKVKFLDIILLASFYLIRVYFGSQVADVPLTDWFLLTITFVFLSLGINKRVLEIALNGEVISQGRGYSSADLAFLKQLMINLVFVALVMLNLHAHFQLQIQMPWFFIFLNLVVFGMISSYFDTASNLEIDDPVERIIGFRVN